MNVKVDEVEKTPSCAYRVHPMNKVDEALARLGLIRIMVSDFQEKRKKAAFYAKLMGLFSWTVFWCWVFKYVSWIPVAFGGVGVLLSVLTMALCNLCLIWAKDYESYLVEFIKRKKEKCDES